VDRIKFTVMGITVLTIAFLFALGTSSFAATAEQGCAKKNNGQLRIVDSCGDCNPAEVCVEFGSGGGGGMDGMNGISCWDLNENMQCDLETEDINESGGCNVEDCQGPQGEQGPATCPSLIGGFGKTKNNASRYFTYFGDKEAAAVTGQKQSVETAGSFTGLNVLAATAPTAGSYTFYLQVDDADTALTCNIGIGGTECINVDTCVDVNPGAKINLRAVNNGTTSGEPAVNHSAVFNGCQCCNGEPPDEDGNCIPVE